MYSCFDTVGEAIALVVSGRGLARNPENGRWIDAVTEIHEQDRHDAAKDLLIALAACGITVCHDVTPTGGNSLAARLLRLASELSRPDLSPAHLAGIRKALCSLAAEARDRDDVVVPPHLRLAEGVTRPEGRRANP